MATISGYNKNDFFYVAAMNGKFMPSDASCSDYDISSPTWDVSCNEINFIDYKDKCIQKELCKNKKYAEKIVEYENGHYGKDEKYVNMKMLYANSYKTTVAWMGGIIVMGIFIYNNRVINFAPPN